MIKNIKVTKDQEDSRIDKWLKRHFSNLSQSFIEKNIRKGFIKINKKKIKANYIVKEYDIINILNYTEATYLSKTKKNFKKNIDKLIVNKLKRSVIFENDDFIIINKWNGLATQGGSKIHISLNDIIKKISINNNLVHRLDKNTSGLIIISKNLRTAKIFGKLFKDNQIKKIYLAICEGAPNKLESVINISHKKKNQSNSYSNSITKYKVIFKKSNFSVILFEPLTGKTHQLRIVSKKIGCPIIGDKRYNQSQIYIREKLKLHALFLKFVINSEKYFFKSTTPKHFIDFLQNDKLKIQIEKSIDNSLKSL